MRDGSIREVDGDGDVVMEDLEQDVHSMHENASTPAAPHTLDGEVVAASACPSPGRPLAERYYRLTTGRGQRVHGTVSVDLLEDVQGIARLDIELR